MSIVELLPQRLKEKRKANGLTLAQVGEQVGLSVSFLSDLEVGRSSPSLDTLVKLAECYRTSVAELCIEIEAQQYIKQIYIRMLENTLQEVQSELRRLANESKEEPA